VGEVATAFVVLVYLLGVWFYSLLLLAIAVALLAGPALIVVGLVRLIAHRVRRPRPEVESAPRRVSRLERERAVQRLRAHWQAERLTVDELEDRVGIALRARWGHELEHVLADLPAPAPARFAGWLRAAAAYNAGWGFVTVLAPGLVAAIAGARGNLVAWQCIGMLVLVYAPAYWWAARFPERHAHLVAIGLAGKTLGILGFLWAFTIGALPLRFGLVTLTNDLLWLPAFAGYLRAAARERGGWHVLLSGA
jgi:hypothetical protein